MGDGTGEEMPKWGEVALTLLLRTLQRRPDRVLKRTFEH
jgi:hypothetical protein